MLPLSLLSLWDLGLKVPSKRIPSSFICSWWAQVGYGVFMVTLGAFIFGQTTANAIFVDLAA